MQISRFASVLLLVVSSSGGQPAHSCRYEVAPYVVCELPNEAEAGQGTDPIAAVWAMFAAFGQKSELAYVGWMTEDFVFDSDDPDFRTAFPSGMSRDDERNFAAHVFHGGARGPDGRLLPHAERVEISAGPLATHPDVNAGQVRVILERLHVRIALSDGAMVDLKTHNQMDVVLTEAGWRVRAWHETHFPLAAEDSLERRLAAAAVRPPDSTRAERSSSWVDGVLPVRLSLVARADHARHALVFDLVLPRGGGALEIFDVLGRRIAQHDLREWGPGKRTLAVDGVPYRAGVYFARLRQNDEAITAKVVWAP